MSAPAQRIRPAVWGALAIVYLVWGSTFLGIRIATRSLPPFWMAATRFVVAGALLYLWSTREKPAEPLGRRQWTAALVVGALLLAIGNGGVVWAQQRIPTGIAALFIASTPLWMAFLEWLVFRVTLKPQAILGLVVGFLGLAFLIRPTLAQSLDVLGSLVCLLAALSWALGSIYARSAPLPKRHSLAAGMEMLAGGGVLALMGLVHGELSDLELAKVTAGSALAVLYLITFGSVIAFTAYNWLLGNAPLSLVSTYAYVNPVVALLLGWLFLDEPITGQTAIAGGVIIFAVALIVSARTPAKSRSG